MFFNRQITRNARKFKFLIIKLKKKCKIELIGHHKIFFIVPNNDVISEIIHVIIVPNNDLISEIIHVTYNFFSMMN